MTRFDDDATREADLNGAPQDPAKTAPDAALLTRSQVARALHRSIATVRRMEGNLLHAEMGPDGVRRFRREQVLQVAITLKAKVTPERSSGMPADAYDGVAAATAYGLFDTGIHPVDVVKRTGLHPLAVAAMHEQWAQMRGGFVVDAKQAREVSAMPWLTRGSLLTSGAELVAALRACPSRSCSECDSELASLCARCAQALKERALTQRTVRERQTREERERRTEAVQMQVMQDARLPRTPRE
jgi:hypothetical protein